LAQLAEEGLARPASEGFVIPWDGIYTILKDEAHSTSIGLLALPSEGNWTPTLESVGTPSGADFTIAISGWRSGTVASSRRPDRIGACLEADGQMWLLSESAWQLLGRLRNLAEDGPSMSSEERMRATGRIVAAAKACSAELDDYLSRTDIVVADRLELAIDKKHVLGEPAVTVTPKLPGAPADWINSFDRFNRVQSRYDVPTPDGGMAHVLPSTAVLEVLDSIKSMPGRRTASDGARAFLYNPYGVLGGEASEVFDPESFARARESAGVRFKTLLPAPGSDPSTFAMRVVDRSGGDEDLLWAVGRTDAAKLLEKARRSASTSLPLFSWEGEEIELGGETDRTLAALRAWISQNALASASILYAEVFNLSSYSDRVVGFEGKIVAVPYIARKDAGQGWIPENVEMGVVTAETDGKHTRRIALTPGQIQELADTVAGARERGEESVSLPGTVEIVPRSEAEAWVESFERYQGETKKRGRDLSPPKEPPHYSGRPLLQILHNIEALDYGAGSVVPPAPTVADPRLPAALRSDAHLLPHQQLGLAWMQHRFQQQPQGIRGCLLADDMGLGKTLQALCLIAWSFEVAKERRPALIVAPVSLLENWKAEIGKFFTGELGSLLELYGEGLQGNRLLVSQVDPQLARIGLKKFLRPEFTSGYSIVLTTYETLRDYEFSIARVPWGIVVCDEAQKIKNPNALVTRAAKALRADFKIACTGTPVENSLADLWCLFDLVQPGLLGSLSEFTRLFRRSIETREAGHEEQIETLRNAISPWVLRRMKDEVSNLPPKIERDQLVAAPGHMTLAMSPLQQKLYAAAVGDFRRALKSEDGRGAILGMLHRLRTICSNPAAVAFEDSERLPIEAHIEHSPKLSWILKRLVEIKALNEKVLIFTEFREVQRLLQRAIVQHFGLLAPIVNGSTTVDAAHDASRQRIVDEFQRTSGFNVIILSTTAMGFGVNIQAANHVIHFTRPWNPAKEDQATDRAHRIGQEKPVYVYYPTVVAPNLETFDQRVDVLLLEKRALSRDMLAGAQEITTQDFESL
jgi:hypothetical protein